jgi:hypothetical protein
MEKTIMRLHVRALALTAGIVWGGAVLLVALANTIWPNYGLGFLGLAASIYPGYHPAPGIVPAVTGGLYGLVDGAIGGAIFAWLYNALSTWFRD